MKVSLLFLFFSCFLFACEKNVIEPEKPISGINYFPVMVGATWEYQVDSILYNSFNTQKNADTFNYWVKESIVEDLSLDSTEKKCRVERFISQDSGKTWFFDRNFVISLSSSMAIRNDFNVSELKLSFPVSEFKTWNGNLFNNKGEKEYIYDWTYKPYTLANVTYDSTLKIVQKDVQNQIRDNNESEIYAAGEGMIEKRIVDLSYKDLERTKIDGLILTYKLLKFNE